MKTFYLAIKIIILLILLFFAVQNTQVVDFYWFGKGGVRLPLIALMFIAFAVGALFGMFAMLGRILTLRGENNSLKRELKKAEKSVEQYIENEISVHSALSADEQKNQTKG
ncbi:MAG: LapA family protein [Neisseriaceae bacterium]|nr:LapA family protein [Neisseriaceae bacterium]MBQ9183313.1 LapA family protein [Neisseriaceae bacterium]MBQ9259711.1 LapA family protein [Neisseriaceae bacterium]MBQ9723885.1 LapA family protein [Neisseriaceae bacterium]MBR1819114.1 LapA family protein [Neisseriaceae bacterium]